MNGRTQKGFTLVELVVAIGIFTVFMIGISVLFTRSVGVVRETTLSIQSALLLGEGMDALRSVRDAGWTTNIASLTNGTTYYLSWSGTQWTITTTPTTIENTFTRSFVLSAVSRDSNDDIVASGGTNDPGTRKVTMTITWPRRTGGAGSETITSIITNLFQN